MQADDVARLWQQRPFVPLRVHLMDGRVLDVRDPRQAIVGRTWIDIGMPGSGLPEGIFDYILTIPLTAIARVEQDSAAASSLAS